MSSNQDHRQKLCFALFMQSITNKPMKSTFLFLLVCLSMRFDKDFKHKHVMSLWLIHSVVHTINHKDLKEVSWPICVGMLVNLFESRYQTESLWIIHGVVHAINHKYFNEVSWPISVGMLVNAFPLSRETHHPLHKHINKTNR